MMNIHKYCAIHVKTILHRQLMHIGNMKNADVAHEVDCERFSAPWCAEDAPVRC